VEDIKIRRLEWAHHIIRMEEERIPKKVLNGNFHTTRPVGRPRNRWADVVQRDVLQLLETKGWRRRAANRDEWRRIMREAKVRKGLSAMGGIYGCMFCMFLYNFVNYVFYFYVYVFLLLCTVLYILYSMHQLALFIYPD